MTIGIPGRLPAALALVMALGATLAACGDAHHHAHEGRHRAHYRPGDGALAVRDGEVVIRAGGTSEDARVAADGSLVIGSRTVETPPEGRAALKQYNADVVAFEQHGAALGLAGAKFGWRTVKDVLGSLFKGKAEEAGARAEEGAKQLEASARELCGRLDSLYRAQQTAADAIPDFRPYAVVSQRQVRDCLDDADEDRGGRDDPDDPDDRETGDGRDRRGGDDAGDRDRGGAREDAPKPAGSDAEA